MNHIPGHIAAHSQKPSMAQDGPAAWEWGISIIIKQNLRELMAHSVFGQRLGGVSVRHKARRANGGGGEPQGVLQAIEPRLGIESSILSRGIGPNPDDMYISFACHQKKL